MPSKIVGKIKTVWASDGTSRTMLIPCDDGIYTASSLASAIGIHVSSLLGRAERHGWHSKAIFAPKSVRQTRIAGGKVIAGINEGNDEWKSLKGRSRRKQDENLSRIENPRPFDFLHGKPFEFAEI